MKELMKEKNETTYGKKVKGRSKRMKKNEKEELSSCFEFSMSP